MSHDKGQYDELKRLLFFVFAACLFFGGPNAAGARTMEEVIAGAKKEGKVRVGITVREKEGGKIAAPRLIEAFEKRYPFVKVEHTRIGGARERERVFSELAGGVVDYDVATLSQTQVPDGIKGNIYEMVDWVKLGVPADDVHPKKVGVTYRVQVFGIAYNTSLLPRKEGQKLTWEEFTQPKWKGKFAIDDRPRHLEVLYQDNAWGREKTLDYARRLAVNKPKFERSRSEAAFKLKAGAFPVFHGARWVDVQRRVDEGVKHVEMALPEPAIISSGDMVFVPRGAKHPNAGILWIVWSLSDEGQKILDEVTHSADPLRPASSVNKFLKGKKLVKAEWDYQLRSTDILKEILQAMGFPVVR